MTRSSSSTEWVGADGRPIYISSIGDIIDGLYIDRIYARTTPREGAVHTLSEPSSPPVGRSKR